MVEARQAQPDWRYNLGTQQGGPGWPCEAGALDAMHSVLCACLADCHVVSWGQAQVNPEFDLRR